MLFDGEVDQAGNYEAYFTISSRADLDIKIDVWGVLSFLIRYFSNYYTLLRDLAARSAPLDPRLEIVK